MSVTQETVANRESSSTSRISKGTLGEARRVYRHIESCISATVAPGPSHKASSGSSDLLTSSRSSVLVDSAKIYCVSLSKVLSYKSATFQRVHVFPVFTL